MYKLCGAYSTCHIIAATVTLSWIKGKRIRTKVFLKAVIAVNITICQDTYPTISDLRPLFIFTYFEYLHCVYIKNQ